MDGAALLTPSATDAENEQKWTKILHKVSKLKGDDKTFFEAVVKSLRIDEWLARDGQRQQQENRVITLGASLHRLSLIYYSTCVELAGQTLCVLVTQNTCFKKKKKKNRSNLIFKKNPLFLFPSLSVHSQLSL